MTAAKSEDAAKAGRLNEQLQPLWDLFIEASSLRVVYAAANILGLCRAAPPRPILPLPEELLRRTHEVMEKLCLA